MNVNPTAVVRNLSTGVVGLIAAYQSYGHMHDLIVSSGEDKYGSEWVVPLSVDGLALAATMTMIQDKRAGRKPRLTAWIGLGVGVVASVAANVMSAQPNPIARVIAGWPAVALAIVIEMVARKGRKDDGPVDSSVLSDAEITDDALAAVAKPRKGRPMIETRAMANHIWAANPTLTKVDVAARLGISAGRLTEVMRLTEKV